LQAEIITLCHAIVEIQQLVVVVNDVSVEVVFQLNFSATYVIYPISGQSGETLCHFNNWHSMLDKGTGGDVRILVSTSLPSKYTKLSKGS
jgi:hypothetical protein